MTNSKAIILILQMLSKKANGKNVVRDELVFRVSIQKVGVM